MSKCSRSKNIFWGIVFCLLGSIFAFFFLKKAFLDTTRAYWHRRLAGENNIIEGTVLKSRRWRPKSSRKSKLEKCFVDYSYNVNGKEYIEEDFPVPTEYLSPSNDRQSISLFVSRENPGRSIPTFYVPQHSTILGYASIGLMSAAASLFFWYLLYLYARGRLTNEILSKKLAQLNRKVI